MGSVLADGDNLPAFVSPELREREPARHFQSVLVLRGNGPAPQTASTNAMIAITPDSIVFMAHSSPVV